MGQSELQEPAAFRRKLDKADFVRMNLPDAYWTVKVQGVQESVRSAVENYLKKIHEMVAMGAGLWISGSEGTGKTAIAALAAKEARSRGYTVYFMSIWELRECIRSRIEFADDMTVLARCREVDLLVLDELREDDRTAPFLGAKELEELIAHRRADGKVTIVTTRLDSEKLVSLFPGLRSASEGGMVWFPVAGKNLRSNRQTELTKAVLG
jgi:DNA replication protein DnaC